MKVNYKLRDKNKKSEINIFFTILTLDSSTVSDNVGGSSRQKNSRTHDVNTSSEELNNPLTNA